MKHKWVCLREPLRDKVADPVHNRDGRLNFNYHTERYYTRPGWYQCETCGYIKECIGAPLECWISVGIIPDCTTEMLRVTHEE